MENYIEQIKKLCAENNIDPTEIVEKITKRFNLGQQAGMSEEEIIEMLGEPESYVVKKEETKQAVVPTSETIDEDYDYDLLEIEVAASVDLTIQNSDDDTAKVDYDGGELETIYTFINEDKKIKLIPVKNYKKISGDITLYLPEKATYKTIQLSTVNGDINSEDYGLICQNISINNVSADIAIAYIKADNTEINNVNGDVVIENLFSKSADVNTVSGDVMINNGKINTLDVSTVSGDVIFNGVVDSVDTSTISGEVDINRKTVSRTITEMIRDGLKDLKF